jgi:putative PEP-CTERM system histidine kinase
MSNSYGPISYGVGALAFAALAVLLLVGRPVGGRMVWLVGASLISVVWGLAAAAALITREESLPLLATLDAAHSLAWTTAALAFLAPAAGAPATAARRWILGLSIAVALYVVAVPGRLVALEEAAGSVYFGLLIMAVLGLLAVEQVYRNALEEQRRPLRLLCLAIGGVFIIDLCVYAYAALFGGVLRGAWESRGLANAAVAPLMVLALRHHPDWERSLFVSRHVVFYTASLLGVGVYLLAMSLITYALRNVAGELSLLLEAGFLVAAVVVLFVVLFSQNIRARLRVLLVKHFYRSKYDYRAEWLRLTDALASAGNLQSLARSALDGVARIVGSQRGHLWITRDGRRYEWMLSLDGDSQVQGAYSPEHPIVKFLAARGWVIDSDEYARVPDLYDSAFGAPADGVLPHGVLIVPLDCRGFLQGLIALERPAGIGRLTFDDHDILKTAGKQVATFFAQAIAQEQLVETRQFEAMNKLSTFLMHDLKNLIAQQELVVANAQRFGDRPDFFKDAIATIRSSVERMKNVLQQLRSGVLQERFSQRAELTKALMEARSRCADREPVPELTMNSDVPIWVPMEREKLVGVFLHLIRNAQDATPADGQIRLTVTARERVVTVSVADTGQGMQVEFIRDRLFRPFDSTKGEEGMGIGAYQVRETMRAAGGDVEVSSELGVGTTFRLTFPQWADTGT